MDGLAMIRAAQKQNADTIFVVLSGYGDYEYTSRAMQLGIRHYILKPCDESKILPVLEQAQRLQAAAPDTQAAGYAGLLGYLADSICQHRTGGEAATKATRTEQLIPREFYSHLPEKELTMQWFARDILFMNPDYLSRKLQQLTGDKFATRLTADRTEIARHLLAEGPDLKLSALAETSGFASDEQYFSRAFRKLVGMTPKQYALGAADKQILSHGKA